MDDCWAMAYWREGGPSNGESAENKRGRPRTRRTKEGGSRAAEDGAENKNDSTVLAGDVSSSEVDVVLV